jgi:hypothetical protein
VVERPGIERLYRFTKIFKRALSEYVLYGERMRVERHWWNGSRSAMSRRDVYVRTDGQQWEVEAQTGGAEGRSTVQQCPGQASAMILADAWLGGRSQWREL